MSDVHADLVASDDTMPAAPLPDAPYRGIEPFRFVDQQIFAARTEEIWTLVSNVTLYRAVLLYGDSGTGKSSLINAGLLPKAPKENYVPDRLRVQPFAGREIKIERIRVSGPDEQAAYLPSNFAAAESEGSAESVEMSLATFRERIEQFRPFSVEARPDASFIESQTTSLPLLVFDQFEEYITLFEEAQRVGGTREAGPALASVITVQKNILATLVELIQDQTLPIKIIFVFREDYLAKLSLLFDHCPELLDQAQRLLPPHIDEVTDIIRAPFINTALVEHFRGQRGAGNAEISGELAQRISNKLGLRSEGDRANLTELQIVCQRLWEASDPEELFALGIEEILKGYGTDVFRYFTSAQRDVAVVLLSHMITASNTRNIVSEGDLLSRTAECDFTESECGAALAALASSQIVRREVRRDIAFYEITSEYLVPWIRELVATRKAAEAQRAAEAARVKSEDERAKALARLEAEQRRALRFQRLLAALVVVLVAAAALGIFALIQYRRAKDAEMAAMRANQTTLDVLKAVQLTSGKNRDDVLSGITQIDSLIKQKLLEPDVIRILLAAVLTSSDLEVKQAALKVALYAISEGNDPELGALVVSVVNNDPVLKQKLEGGAEQAFQNLSKSLRARFYIHIAEESQLDEAQKIAEELRKKYVVPGISISGVNAPRLNELRYFRKNDPGMPTPQDIVELLNQMPASREWIETYTEGYENAPNIGPGHYELWFAAVSGSWLRAYLVDEQNNRLKGLRVLFIVTSRDGKEIRKNTGYIPLPPGEYTVEVLVEGYGRILWVGLVIKANDETIFPIVVLEKGHLRPKQPYSLKETVEK